MTSPPAYLALENVEVREGGREGREGGMEGERTLIDTNYSGKGTLSLSPLPPSLPPFK